MIRKLLKVEFRDALSSMLPIGVGMVALSALVALTSVLTGRLGFHFLKRAGVKNIAVARLGKISRVILSD